MDKAELQEKLAIAEYNYKAAVRAIPYMPADARPYTVETARRYWKEVRDLEEKINAHK